MSQKRGTMCQNMGLEMGKPGHSVHSREGGLVRGKAGNTGREPTVQGTAEQRLGGQTFEDSSSTEDYKDFLPFRKIVLAAALSKC